MQNKPSIKISHYGGLSVDANELFDTAEVRKIILEFADYGITTKGDKDDEHASKTAKRNP